MGFGLIAWVHLAADEGGQEMSLHLILNRLVPLLDLPLEAQDVLLQGLDDSLQLHLLSLQGLDVIGSLFNLLLQAAELKIQMATTKTTKSSSPFPPTGCRLKGLPIRIGDSQEFPRPNGCYSILSIRSSPIPYVRMDCLHQEAPETSSPTGPRVSHHQLALKGWTPCSSKVTRD